MGATFARIKVWIPGEILTAADLNAEFDNILNNLSPTGIDDISSDLAAMQAMRDPYPGAAADLAVDLDEEMKSLRYQLKEILGESYWYIDPDTTIAALKTLTDAHSAGQMDVVSKTANYTATTADGAILVDATAGGVTVTLPTAVGNTDKFYLIKKTDVSVNTVTVDGNGTETVDGALTFVLSNRYDFVGIISDGANWHIIYGFTALPSVADLTNIQHTHGDTANGGSLAAGAIAADSIGQAEIDWANAGGVSQQTLLESDGGHGDSSGSWVTVFTGKVYIPANANDLEYYLKVTSLALAGTHNFRLICSSANGTTVNNTTTDDPQWEGSGALDISAESGSIEINVQVQDAGLGSPEIYGAVYRIK